MPELPEVETIRRDLEMSLQGDTVTSVLVYDQRLLPPQEQDRWQRVVPGARCLGFDRKGKYLFVRLSNDYQIIFHLRMTGQLILQDPSIDKKARLLLCFGSGKHLGLYDQRRFAEAWLLAPGERWRSRRPLGPDALTELDFRHFSHLLKKRKTKIQPLLMDQQALAGVGNIYAQEALFKAAIRPTRASCRVTQAEGARLFDSLLETLEEAIEHRGSTSRNYMDAFGHPGSAQTRHLVYRKAGSSCPRCHAQLRGIRVGGRSSVYCPRCQK